MGIIDRQVKAEAVGLIMKGLSMLGEKPPVFQTGVAETIDLTNPATIDGAAILQNRNRSGKASIFQMKSIAANPDFDRLSGTKDFGSGAPVVAFGKVPENQKGKVTKAIMQDGERFTVQYAVVEAKTVITSNDINGATNQAYHSNDASHIRAIAGNGRVTGITEAYRNGRAEGYRVALLAECTDYGLNKKVVEKMAAPMLVRIMQPKDVSADIGDKSNRGGGLAMSAVELANNDKHRIDFDTVKTSEDGSITIDSLKDFVAQMPEAERGLMLDSDGQPTKQAEDRANAAVFAKAYENDELTRMKTQALEPDAKTIINGMGVAAPAIAKLAGLPDGFDIRDVIASAANTAIQSIRKGVRLEEAAMQTAMFASDDDDAAAREVIKMFAKNRRSAKAIGDALARMADKLYQEAQLESEDMGMALFGEDELEKETRAQIIRRSLTLDGVKMSGYGNWAWGTVAGGDAIRWLFDLDDRKPTAFFDSIREISRGIYDSVHF